MLNAGTIRPLSELENLEIQRERLLELQRSQLISSSVKRQMQVTLSLVEQRISGLKIMPPMRQAA